MTLSDRDLREVLLGPDRHQARTEGHGDPAGIPRAVPCICRPGWRARRLTGRWISYADASSPAGEPLVIFSAEVKAGVEGKYYAEVVVESELGTVTFTIHESMVCDGTVNVEIEGDVGGELVGLTAHLNNRRVANYPHQPVESLTRLAANERELIIRTLGECRGNKTEAASRLGIAYSTLFRKLRRYGLVSSENPVEEGSQ